MIVKRLTQHPDIYLYEMVRDEFGIDPRVAEESGLRGPLAMGASYAIGSLVPIVPFLLPLAMRTFDRRLAGLRDRGTLQRGRLCRPLSGRSPFRKGLEIAAFGCAVFAISYLAGHFIPPLFGHAPVSPSG